MAENDESVRVDDGMEEMEKQQQQQEEAINAPKYLPPLQPLPPLVRHDISANDGQGGNRARLVIEKMILENFKSYAGIQEIGPFHRCFTAIVGPNGSGKCLAPETSVLLADGRTQQAKDLKIGDLLIGDDSTPRVILTTTTGNSPLFRVQPTAPSLESGFVCNDKHLLVLDDKNQTVTVECSKLYAEIASGQTSHQLPQAFRCSVNHFPIEFNLQSLISKHNHSNICLKDVDLARFFGFLLGSSSNSSNSNVNFEDASIQNFLCNFATLCGLKLSTSKQQNEQMFLIQSASGKEYHLTGNKTKHPNENIVYLIAKELGLFGSSSVIPPKLLSASHSVRSNLLYGIIEVSCGNQITISNKDLSFQIVSLARSLGFKSSIQPSFNNDSFIVSISNDIPISTKSHYDFQIDALGNGDYCGFTLGVFTKDHFFQDYLNATQNDNQENIEDILISMLENDEIAMSSFDGSSIDGRYPGRFLLADYTVTHNSNVLDALLFVFGKRAKQIRQRKIGELVHKSATHPDIQTASVTVHFKEVVDGENGETTPVPKSELVLKRTATRQHQSKYYVNGHGATFTEVTDLLRAKGVDLENNRFLILQGEVEQIAMMAPKSPVGRDDPGMLEYLEDIIGTNRYITMIDERTKALEQVQEERTEKLNRAKLAERERQSLEAAKQEAEDFIAKDKEIVRKRALIAMSQRRACEREAEAMESKKHQLTTKLQEEREKAKAAAAKLKEAEESTKRAANEMERLSSRAEKAKADFAAFQRHDVKLREDAKHLKAQEKKLRKAIEVEEQKAETLESDAEKREREHQEEVERTEKLKTELEREEAQLDEVYKSLRGITGPLQERMESLQRELLPAQTKRTETESSRTMLASELKMLQGAEGEKAKRVEEAREIFSTLKEAEEKTVAEIERTVAALKDRKQRVIKSKESQQILANEEQKLANEVRVLRARVEEIKSQAAAVKSRGAVFEAISGLMASKKVPGIFGRLGDLGKINAKYDVAVTTACGALDNIVVQTTEAAQQCVEFLRQGNVGRATFAILDVISKNEHVRNGLDAEFEAPADSRRLFDLIEVSKPQFKQAFYWALADTLVVKDLESATRVAFGGQQRKRVVTFQGELIEVQGTMSGGGKSIARGGMRTTTKDSTGPTTTSKSAQKQQRDDENDEEMSDERTLEELQEQLTHTMEAFEKAKKAKTVADVEVASLESLSDTTTAKLQMDLQAKRAQREEAEKALNAIQEKPALTDAQKKREKELGKLIAECERNIEELIKRTEDQEHEMSELKEKIMAAGGTKLREQKEKVASLTEELSKAERAATKCLVDVGTFGKQAEKSKKAVAKAKADLEEALEKLEAVKKEQKELEDKALDVMNAHEDARKAAEAKGEEVKAYQQELDKLREETSKATGSEVGIVDELEECTKQLAERQRATKSYTKQLSDLQEVWTGLEEMLRGGQVEENQITSVVSAASNKVTATANDGDDPDAMSVDKEESKEENDGNPFRDTPKEKLDKCNIEELKVDIGALEEAKSKMSPNMGAIAEYRAKTREYAARMKELEEVTAIRDRFRSECELLRKRRLDEFMEGFEQITMKLKEMYRMITIGGDAELELVDRLNPFSEGVVFSVRPAKKSWKLISNLSGGEKTLSSLALVFALHHYKPTPLYVMDEIDAALDFRNVSIVANYIKERTRGAQFVVVSLRNYMFELADQLVGIFKIADCTGSIAIAPSQYASALPLPQQQQQQQQSSQQQIQASQQVIPASGAPSIQKIK